MGTSFYDDLWNEIFELCICLSLELIHWSTEIICDDCHICLEEPLKKLLNWYTALQVKSILEYKLCPELQPTLTM